MEDFDSEPWAEDGPRVWKASELKPGAQPRWLAKNRLPLGATSLVVGDEEIGKSLFWVWLAAVVTTGKPMPEFGIPARDPQDVMIVITEDDWSTTVHPRLKVAGADLDRISVVCTEQDGSGAPVFPRDIYLIAETEPPPALVVVDAWLDTVPSNLRVQDGQQARQALHPWKELADTTGASVLLLCHTNRTGSPSARDRYATTSELRKKARMCLYAQSQEKGQLIIGPEKANTAAPTPASIFRIRPVQHFDPTEDHDGTVPILEYEGDASRTATQLVTDSVFGDPSDSKESKPNPALEFVLCYLEEVGGAAPTSDIFESGRDEGFSKKDLQNARNRSTQPRIRAIKGGFDSGWIWCREDMVARKIVKKSKDLDAPKDSPKDSSENASDL